MKMFSLVALLLCAAMVGCKKDDGKGSATGTAVKTVTSPSPSPTPTTTAPPATAPVGS